MIEIKFRAFFEGQMVQCGVANNCNHPIRITELDFSKQAQTMHLLPVDTPVMQFTGLKDKNGKAIYAGDVCNGKRPGFSETFLGKIEYHNDIASYCLNVGDRYMAIPIIEFDELTVIGNIYENPELLK